MPTNDTERAALRQPLPKPMRDSGRSERKARKFAAKRGIEPETHEEKLARIEFWRVLRLDLYARDSGRCRACGIDLDLDAGLAANAFHAHHLKHRSQGGGDTLDNLVSLCGKCHRAHHDGRLIIAGSVRCLDFIAKTLKGITTRVWQSVLA